MRSLGCQAFLAASAALLCATAGGRGTCRDPAGECTADETPLLQVQPQSALSAERPRKSFLANVVPVRKPGDRFPGPRGAARVTASFSGGGTRALSVVTGAWRGLHALGLAGKFDGVASVSGGSWANSQYMFAKKCKATGKDVTNTDLLGPETKPSQLSMEYLGTTTSMIAATGNRSAGAAIAQYVRTLVAKCASVYAANGNVTLCQQAAEDAWVKVYGYIMLEPYGLDGEDFLAASEDAVQDILERNPDLKQRKATFVTPRTDRPKSYVIVGVLDAPRDYIATSDNIVTFQMSADYTGSPYYPNGGSDVQYIRTLSFDTKPLFLERTVGGGFVETFAFGGLAPKLQSGGGLGPQKVPSPKVPFTLSDAIGISSQAAATALTKANIAQALDPAHLYWPITRDAGEREKAVKYTFGDGGNMDNLGVIPMLQSGAEKLVVFFAASSRITGKVDLCKVDPGYDFTDAAATDLASLFGYSDRYSIGSLAYVYRRNKVFRKNDYPALLCGLQTLKKSGRPAVFRQSLTVVENDWWGVVGGRKVDVLWYYLDRVRRFLNKLPNDTREEVDKKGDGPFANFPIYVSEFQNPPEFTAYTTEQINLLVAQVEYSVRRNADLFRDFLS